MNMKRVILCHISEYKYLKEYIETFPTVDSIYIYEFNSQVLQENVYYLCIRRVPYSILPENCIIGFINTEQLSVPSKMAEYRTNLARVTDLYDYSLENIRILNSTRHIIHVPYVENTEETSKLRSYMNVEKEFDVCVIGTWSYARQSYVDILNANGFRVDFIYGLFGDERDVRIGKSRILLNVHYESTYTVYENIRCERWRFAGMPVITEACSDSVEGMPVCTMNTVCDVLRNMLSKKLYAIYIKFRYSTIHTIQQWKHILDTVDYSIADVYIWMYDSMSSNIFTDPTIIALQKEYPSAKFISNYNQNDYLTNEDRQTISDFHSKEIVEDHHKAIGESHLKAFLIPKNVEYIFKLDGDDMFYPNFKVSYFEQCIRKMKESNIAIMSRPYWARFSRGWSFGFTVAKSTILDILQFRSVSKKYTEWKDEAVGTYYHDAAGVLNLDNLFGNLLFTKNIRIQDSFFYMNEYTWENQDENLFIEMNGCIKV